MEIISLATLCAVIALSCFTKVNPGFLALGLAWILGTYGAKLSISQIAAGFPVYMFIVLVGITFLFGIAKHNGTLDKLAQAALKIIRNNTLAAPLLFFLFAAGFSTLGAGNIGGVALLAPVAMTVAWETGIGAFIMTIILVCGSNAGAFSPFSMTGIIANGLIDKLNLNMNPWTQVYWPNFLAQAVLASICYLIFIIRLKQNKHTLHPSGQLSANNDTPWNFEQIFTLSTIGVLIAATVFLKADIGFLAILLACVLVLFNIGDSKEGIKHIPWNTILMVCGVNTLVSILENMGGLNLLTDLLAKISNPQNVTMVTAFITGLISAFSSSSGVVLPTFIPLVPQLIDKIGGGDPVAIVSSINVGAHLVDISPLSSLGAICVASVLHEDKDKLFRLLLGFGMSMALVGALICYLLFSWI